MKKIVYSIFLSIGLALTSYGQAITPTKYTQVINPELAGLQKIQLRTAPTDSVNPPSGYVFVWYSLDGSSNLVVNYRTPAGTNKTLSSTDPANIVQTATYNFVSSTEKSTWNGKQDALGYTPASISALSNINAQFASYQVNLGFTPATVASVSAVNAQLASYQVNLGYTAENSSNKSNDIVTDQASTTKYATTGSIWTWVKGLLSINQISNVGTGAGLYKDRIGDNVRIKSLLAGENISLQEYDNEIRINSTASGGAVSAGFSSAFSSADTTGFVWTSNVLTVTHALGTKYNNITVYNSAEDQVNYAITAVDTNSITITVPASAMPITGTWHIVIK